MDIYKETIRNAPPFVPIPKELRNRDIEITIVPLNEKVENGDAVEVDKNGYPLGFFERTFGILPDFPDREPQPIQPDREEIE